MAVEEVRATRPATGLGGASAIREPVAAELPLEAMSMFSAIAMASSSEDSAQLLNLVARGAAALLGASRCAVYLRDKETGLFAGRCSYGAPKHDSHIRRTACGHDGDGLTREILATRSAVAVSNARQDPRPIHNVVLQWGVHSLIGAPIVNGDEVTGLIFVDDNRPQVFEGRDQRLLETFGALVGGVIGRAAEREALRDRVSSLSDHNRSLQMMLAFGDRLARAVAAGAGREEVATTVADFTHKACAIYDERGRRQASAVPSDVAADEFGEPVQTLADPAVAEAAANGEPGRPVVVTLSGAAGSARRLLLLRGTEESAAGGTIVLQEGSHQRLQVLDAKVLRHAAAMVDLIARAELDRAECLRGLTAALLLGDDPADVRARAGNHSVDLAAPRIVCLFARRDSDEEGLGEEAVASRFQQVSGTHPELIAPIGDRVAVALELDPHTPVPKRVEETKRSLTCLAADSWQVGMSSPCYQLEDYRQALAETEQALVACAESGAPVATVDDLGAGYLLSFGIDSDRAARFARAVMAPLLDDPSDAGAALIGTLRTFFACGRNIRLTARRLDVHENTIRYRLGSVERRTGLDVAGDPRDELAVQIALELMGDAKSEVCAPPDLDDEPSVVS